MKVPVIKISELADPEPGSFKIGPFGSSLKKDELVSEGIPVVGIENVLDNTFTAPFRRYITEEKYKQLRQYTIKPGDILVTTMGTIGYAAIVPTNIGTMIIDSHLFRMRVDQSKVYPPYLCYAINYYEGIKQHLQQTSRGAIMEGLNTTILKECSLPLPKPAEQKRIATILEKADRLRQQRRYALELSDTYLQTVFLEMFGDPVSNPKGWVQEHLGEKITFITSGSRGWARYYSDKGAIFIRIQNVGRNQLLLDDLAHVQIPHGTEGQRTRVQSGDLLLSITADLGRTAVIPENFPEAYINQHLALLRLKDLHPIFVAGFISTPGGKTQISQLDRAGVKSGLNFDDIRGYRIYIPPLPLQQQFAHIVQKYQRLRAQQREAERQAEHLFQTLLHRAFQGELTREFAAQDVPGEEAHRMDEPAVPYPLTAPVRLIVKETEQLALPMD